MSSHLATGTCLDKTSHDSCRANMLEATSQKLKSGDILLPLLRSIFIYRSEDRKMVRNIVTNGHDNKYTAKTVRLSETEVASPILVSISKRNNGYYYCDDFLFQL